MQKTKYAIMAMIMALIILSPACKCDNESGSTIPKTGTVKVKTIDDINRNNTYCKYEVTGAPSTGVAQLAVGNIICIMCPDGKTGCDNYSKVEMDDGAVYPVKALTNGLACTTCPKGVDTPPGFPYQEK